MQLLKGAKVSVSLLDEQYPTCSSERFVCKRWQKHMALSDLQRCQEAHNLSQFDSKSFEYWTLRGVGRCQVSSGRLRRDSSDPSTVPAALF